MQVLVGNKCDMDESKRVVPYSKGQALADEFGIQFFETSAKSNLKVDEVMRCAWSAQDCASCLLLCLLHTGMAKLATVMCISNLLLFVESCWQELRTHM